MIQISKVLNLVSENLLIGKGLIPIADATASNSFFFFKPFPFAPPISWYKSTRASFMSGLNFSLACFNAFARLCPLHEPRSQLRYFFHHSCNYTTFYSLHCTASIHTNIYQLASNINIVLSKGLDDCLCYSFCISSF